ncbi:hypothetical protein ACFE04_005194 [Oxalis oulophora]
MIKQGFIICQQSGGAAIKQIMPRAEYVCSNLGADIPHLRFVSELVRVAKPGGTIIITAWCCRDLKPSEKSLQMWEKQLLDKISAVYCLPEWCSVSDYVKLLKSQPVVDIKSDDWTQYVLPFWPQALRKAFSWKGIVSLLRNGFNTVKATWAALWMIDGYNKGVIKFGIVACRKAK